MTKRQYDKDGGNIVIVPTNLTVYDYKYNGKEWQDELSLNMYDMDMRQYDPAIARWVVQDPVVHHNYSPYSAFDNNPVFYADPSGADSVSSLQEMWDATPEGGSSTWHNRGNGSFSNDPKEGQMMTTKVSHTNALDGVDSFTYITQYYHSGGLNGSTAGWYSENDYLNILYNGIKFQLNYEWDGGDNAVEGFAELIRHIADKVEYDSDYNRYGFITPMGFDSPFFIGGGASKFLNTGSKVGTQGIKSLGAASKGFSKLPKGFKEVKDFGYQHGQKVYSYKGKFYSRDVDGHNSGVWKVFENSGGKLKRIGTADHNLDIFKQ